jgi:penicillin-binding protein 2
MRENYDKLLHDQKRPLWSKVTQAIYPPGSVMKPFILVIGLQENKVDPWEIISCPYQSAPRGWPDCLQFSRFHGCHDWKWQGQGGNRGRNAIRGSCNIYFSRLANRIDSDKLQRWLYAFGYGRKILPPPPFQAMLDKMKRSAGRDRKLPESQGIISSQMPPQNPKISELPPIRTYEKRMFGIGQGSLRATVLQIANAMATLSRSGLFRHPKIFTASSDQNTQYQPVNLGLSKKRTIETLRDGMYAVVNEPGGTAYNAFKGSPLMDKSLGLSIYGKTGSTEKPYNALFAGFVEDKSGRALSIAIVVEGGQAGSQDAAPLAVEIIKLCSQAGYIGTIPSQAGVCSDSKYTQVSLR